MLKKLKRWLYERFLPAYCRDALLEENAALKEQIREYQRENGQLRAYIDGMETAIRRHSRITINAKEVSRS